ncbi:hypothetical protein PGSY75_1330100, partial [Plasmodium gaboni]
FFVIDLCINKNIFLSNKNNLFINNIEEFERGKRKKKLCVNFIRTNNKNYYKKNWGNNLYNKKHIVLKAKKFDQKELKRRKNYQYAMKHMYDNNGRRIKDINKEKKSLKKKKLFDYE